MPDWNELEKYRENNRIEAKLAMGGLPESVWETYSSFANTMGGVILLGVEEKEDRSLHPVILPDPEGMKEAILKILNDRERVSCNLLGEDSIRIIDTGSAVFIAIEVPRAPRALRPVYLDADPSKCYRRSGDGDFRCSEEERLAMIRDALDETQDTELLPERNMRDLESHTLSLFLKDMVSALPEGDEDTDTERFLLSCRIAAEDETGELHPTAAGLLMFGKREKIEEEFPSFCPEYLEISGNGDFYIGNGENIYSFWRKVRDRILTWEEIGPAGQEALTEALVNCLVNADYHSEESLLIIREYDKMTFTNPGGFRIGVDSALLGGISDPRNAVMLELFSMTERARKTGSGIPSIFRLWKASGWKAPLIAESAEPGRMRVCLTMERGEETDPELKDASDREKLTEFLTDNISAGLDDIMIFLSSSRARTRLLLQKMTADGILTVSGTNRNKKYRLTEKVNINR